MILAMLPTISIVYFFVYYKKGHEKEFVRTEKGDKLNLKINGLKNFLKDFSNLDEKKIIHIRKWEEYLIYSVIFDQNDKLLAELRQIINNLATPLTKQ